jgi:hypothetical protein
VDYLEDKLVGTVLVPRALKVGTVVLIHSQVRAMFAPSLDVVGGQSDVTLTVDKVSDGVDS